MSFDPRGGRVQSGRTSDAASCPSTADQESALAVSLTPVCYWSSLRPTNQFLEDFALTEASYGIVRILQTYPNLRLAPDCPNEPSGQEKQTITFVVASAEGCKVLLN